MAGAAQGARTPTAREGATPTKGNLVLLGPWSQ